jgi:hypothetical protein
MLQRSHDDTGASTLTVTQGSTSATSTATRNTARSVRAEPSPPRPVGDEPNAEPAPDIPVPITGLFATWLSGPLQLTESRPGSAWTGPQLRELRFVHPSVLVGGMLCGVTVIVEEDTAVGGRPAGWQRRSARMCWSWPMWMPCTVSRR